MLTSNLNATRFAQKPLHQPIYSFSSVPKASADLSHSSLQYVDSRDDFHRSMGEMLLLCKEAIRRRPDKKGPGGSKPLSLEYLADRFDIDDPLFGYLVRTKEEPPAKMRSGNDNSDWRKGMLQGFITVTTFTNYQKSFRWDSLHSAAFSYDDDELMQERMNGERKLDEDGSLAAAMQATVRCGDIWNEGIVWPRIAEISLLGGLGCGATLVKLVIEHLECMRATGKANYDFVILQATDNSISFYESMGFVRVGAIVKEENVNKSDSSDDEDAIAEPLPMDSPEKANAVAQTADIVTSPLTQYTTKKAGETPNDIAKRFSVDVWDIVFLNKDIFAGICPTSRLLPGTNLYVPVYEKIELPTKQKSRDAEPPALPQYYIADEDDTPREIAKKFNVSCAMLVEANKGRLEGLVSSSRLMAGTRVKVSHLDVPEDDFKPYPHWSFPDDTFDDPEPSYMMALKLNRKRGISTRERPVLESLAVPISKYEPTELVLPPSPGPIDYDITHPKSLADIRSPAQNKVKLKKNKRISVIPGAPVPPKREPGAFLLFANDVRVERGQEVMGLSGSAANGYFAKAWKQLSAEDKAPYEAKANTLREKYFRDKALYEKKLAAFLLDNPEYEATAGVTAPLKVAATSSSTAAFTETNNGMSLYNKVVRLRPGAMTEGSEFTYWYVLTYIPDLKWCHLAPMKACGNFGDDKPKSRGRTKYRLVDEKLGKEVDISSSFCIPIKARAMKKTLDADMEEWDVVDDGSEPDMEVNQPRVSNSAIRNSSRPLRTSPVKPSAVPKPPTGLKRKIPQASAGDSCLRLPTMMALLPEGESEVVVRLVGKEIYYPTAIYPSSTANLGHQNESNSSKKRKRLSNGQDEVIVEIVVTKAKRGGRTKGSKNKPKNIEVAPAPVEVNDVAITNITSPLTRSRGQEQEPASKRVRLSSPQTSRPSRIEKEHKENSKLAGQIDSSKTSHVQPHSLDFAAARRSSPRGSSSHVKTASITTQLVTTSSPRRLPRGTVGPSHKRTRHCMSSPSPTIEKRTLRSSAPSPMIDPTPPSTRRRQSPRLNITSAVRRSITTIREKYAQKHQQTELVNNARPKRKAAPEFLGEDTVGAHEKRRRID
ncbi:hypothetical protein MPSEU_000380400 [Mayamaea pseudoterrestris]|nr:hypothetical protein MPSEU_000380400 [Mayamaea pseudoterrestris]